MVEDPNPPPALKETPPKDRIVNEKGQVETPHLESGNVSKPVLVTTSLSRTLDCLFANNASVFRCLPKYMGMTFLRGLVAQFFAYLFPEIIPTAVSVVLADVVLTRWHVAFIHSVISKENKLNIFKRVFSIKRPCSPAMRKATISVLVCSLAECAATYLPQGLALDWFNEADGSNDNDITINLSPSTVIFVCLGIGCLLKFLLVIPATVSKVRVAASIFAVSNARLAENQPLPETEDSIKSSKESYIRALLAKPKEPEEMLLPFDPTFDGMINEGEVIGVLDAWRSCDGASRCRIVKIYAFAGLLYVAQLALIYVAFRCVHPDGAEGMSGLNKRWMMI